MNSPRKILLIMTLLLVVAAILFETNITDKKESWLAQMEAQLQGDAYRVDCGDCDVLILPWSNDIGERFLFLPSASEKYEKVEGSVSGKDSDVTVVRSSEVASIFVLLKNDTLETVDTNKGYMAQAYVTIISADGTIEYSKELEYIKSRGNGSYNTEKKPYEIKLTHSQGLLGMSAAKEWILLANAYDCSLLKNSLVQDFAANYTDLPDAVNEPVDLYVNGEYRGSYLLSKKVQVRDGYIEISNLEKRNTTVNGDIENAGYQQIVEEDINYVTGIENPKDITGGYLVEIVPENLLDDATSYFYTNSGTLFKIKHPQYASKEEVCYIKGIFDEVELALSTDNGVNPNTGRHYSEIIDIDSWIQKSLLELVFQNHDIAYASMYFYKDSDSINSKLYAGMPWDYDLCLENTVSTDYFPFNCRMYLSDELLQFEEVRDAFEREYENTFVSFVENDLDAYLAQKEQEIAGSYYMNAIRWDKLGRTNNFTKGYSSLEANVDFLSRKMRDSIDAANRWLYQNDNYCVVSFVEANQQFLVEKGTKPDFQIPIYADYINIFEGWKDSNGKFLDKDTVIENDVEYHASFISLQTIFSASEAELLALDLSRVSSDILEKIITGLKKQQSGNEGAFEMITSEIDANAVGDEVEVVFLNRDGSVLQILTVECGTMLKQVPMPEWEDGIFLRWRRTDNAEFLNENVYIFEPTVYEAEWIYVPWLIINGLDAVDKSIEEIDIEMLERVFGAEVTGEGQKK